MKSPQTDSLQPNPRKHSFIITIYLRQKDNLFGLGSYVFKTLMIWLLLAGAIAVLLLVWKPGFLAADPYPKILELLATVLLSGGVFQVLLKSMQYSNVFRSELSEVMAEIGIVNQKDMLSNVMYEPEVLSNRKDLEEIWKKVSKLVYHNNFPEISDLIAGRVLSEYFPKDDNFYYDKFEEEMQISALPDGKHIEVRSILKFIIKAMDSSQEVNWNYGNEFRKDPADEVARFELEELRINRVSKLTDFPNAIRDIEDGKKLRLDLSLKLEHSKEYEVRLVEKKVYDPAIDGIKDFTSRRFINNLTLNVTYPGESLEVFHSPVGTGTKGTLEQTDNSLSYFYNDLIFPHQGYRLVLRKRG
jgi:hypothetical protein